MYRASFSCIEMLESRQLLSTTTTLLDAEFSDPAVSSANWHRPAFDSSGSTFLGRTQLRVSQNQPMPVTVNHAVRLYLDSYNPTMLPGKPSFFGDELISNKTFSVGDGLIMSVRARLNSPILGGVVGASFFYGVKPGTANHDESDTELLSNEVVSGQQRMESNVFANEPLGVGAPVFSHLPAGGKLTAYHTYTIAMYPDHDEWRVDSVVVRSEKNIVPVGPVHAYLNIWAPASDWPAAYNAAIAPTSNAAQNKRFSMDVDWVRITQVHNPVVTKPGIRITSVAPRGRSGSASGQVVGVDLSKYQGVAVYIKVGSGWWTKPFFNQPITAIQPDGLWSAQITTGGFTDINNATEVRAYLIPVGFTVPLDGGGALSPTLTPLLSADVLR
ncbi:MAG TPA: glycoside hydrolase family 16 protein [Humisphaera sp.]|jgi:hypothetical protein|nr:glycoside hydrolase family 16 protein [Humisphaera sp.]